MQFKRGTALPYEILPLFYQEGVSGWTGLTLYYLYYAKNAQILKCDIVTAPSRVHCAT